MKWYPNLLIFIFFIFVFLGFYAQSPVVVSSAKKNFLTLINKNELPQDSVKRGLKISREWDLPQILKEISGINFLDSNHFACIQDEIGSIFLLNSSSGLIETQIPFGPPGDYEAIAIVKGDAYVACADGRLYEISNYNSGKPSVKEYGTHLTVKQNVEGLAYDAINKRLLVAIKGKEENNSFYKGIYAFDLVTKKMPVKPVLRINIQDIVFNKNRKKTLISNIHPSEIAIHPVTGDLYITDASRPQLLIMDNTGKIKDLIPLDKNDFPKPEGITFSPAGECYIANEGKKQQPAKLLLVDLKP